jgi:hypothetical protein
MASRFTAELTYTGRELVRIRHDIAHADVAVLATSAQVKDRSAVIRAHVYVWLAALLERVVRDAIRDSLRELNSLGLSHNKVRASLFALLCDPEIMSVVDRTRQAAWGIRVGLFDRVLTHAPAVFSEDILPLDAKTLRGEHFDNIWVVFGLSGPSLPGPQHRVALKDLAEGRNEVAHGHLDPVIFGKAKATSDLLRLATRVDEIITHLLNALDQYIGKRHYSR